MHVHTHHMFLRPFLCYWTPRLLPHLASVKSAMKVTDVPANSAVETQTPEGKHLEKAGLGPIVGLVNIF